MARILITGASGDLGKPLSKTAAQAEKWDIAGTYFRQAAIGGGRAIQVDLRRRNETLALIEAIRPDVIIHAAASDRSSDMEDTIRLAAMHIGEAAHRTGCRLIALSTDMVFDGKHPPYPEDAVPSPLSDYGRVKAETERLLLDCHNNCLIVRTSLIYDFTPANRQVGWMLALIERGESVPLFTDEYRQPIWAVNLAHILLDLAAGQERGILNVAGPVTLSRWEYGTRLLKTMGFAPDKVAQPVKAADIRPNRPQNVTLCLDRARSILKTPLLSLEQAAMESA